jgi:arylformamidase
LRGLFGLSGLYDLEPVRRSNVNEWLRLPDAAAAQRNSPAACLPRENPMVIAAVAEKDTGEFHRQSRAYAETCAAAGFAARYLEAGGHNHYTIVLELGDPSSALSLLLRDMLGLQVDSEDLISGSGS